MLSGLSCGGLPNSSRRLGACRLLAAVATALLGREVVEEVSACWPHGQLRTAPEPRNPTHGRQAAARNATSSSVAGGSCNTAVCMLNAVLCSSVQVPHGPPYSIARHAACRGSTPSGRALASGCDFWTLHTSSRTRAGLIDRWPPVSMQPQQGRPRPLCIGTCKAASELLRQAN
jgi:hypothetical protein